jgi:hypothetical protein
MSARRGLILVAAITGNRAEAGHNAKDHRVYCTQQDHSRVNPRLRIHQ